MKLIRSLLLTLSLVACAKPVKPCLPNGGVLGIQLEDGATIPDGTPLPPEVSVKLADVEELAPLALKGKAVISLQNLQTLVDACQFNAGEKK